MRGPLRIGFEHNPPFQVRKENALGGLAVEIINEAAKRSGLKLTWIDTGTSSDEAFLKGLVDLWPLMSDLPERRQYVHFTKPWLHAHHVLLLRDSVAPPEDDFTGRMALFKLPLHARLLHQKFPKAQLTQLSDSREVVKQVCRGAVTAGFLEKLVAVNALKERPTECGSTPIRAQTLPDLTLKTCVASTFDAAGAADLLRREIGNQFRDGTLAVIMAKYSFYGLDETWSTYEMLDTVERERWIAWGTGAVAVALILIVYQNLLLRQRRRAERVLRESEERFKTLFHHAGVGVAQLSLDGKVELANERYCQVVGYTREELAKKGTLELTHREDLKVEASLLPRLIAGEIKTFSTEKRYARKDGTMVWAMMWKSLVRDGQGRPKCFIAVVEDITERKQAEAALKESEQRFRIMADSAPVMIWISGPDKRCTFFNQGWLSFTGRTMEQELGDGWAAGVHPDDLERCLQIYSSAFDVRREFQMEYRLRRADGEYRWILDFGVPRFANGGTFVGYMGSCIDITERRRVQEEALDRYKLETLGVLASGIAHYFNNLLGGILASAELLSAERTEDSRPEEEELTRIKTDALRGGEVVRQLMIYSGEESHAFEPVVLSDLINEMLPLLRLSITKSVTLRVDLPGGLPPVRANSAQMRHVFMNLVTNASEAIGDKAGVIKIAAEHRRCVPDCSGGDALPGGHIRLSVRDDGCGMTTEILAKIFDPFYTTKFAGRGLGLAIVQRVICNHGGMINVVSEPGQGSCFEINLPCMNVP